VECFKCEEEGHKCRECPSWEKMREERRLRRAEEEEAVHPTKGEVQQKQGRTSVAKLRI